jgi:hypothetical protein
VAREQSAAGAGRVSAAEASALSGSVEEANEPEHLEGSLAHLTFGEVFVPFTSVDRQRTTSWETVTISATAPRAQALGGSQAAVATALVCRDETRERRTTRAALS